MDIIAFLTEDHRQIIRLLDLARDRNDPRPEREKLNEFLTHLRTHEEIESRLFKALQKVRQDESLQFIVSNYEKLHQALWQVIRLHINALKHAVPAMIDRTFDDLDWIIRQHIQSEEGILFQKISSRLSKEELDRLGSFQFDKPPETLKEVKHAAFP